MIQFTMINRIKTFILFFTIFYFLTGQAWASLSVSASMDDHDISLDEDTTITVSISGAMSTSEPVVPKVSGLSIIKTGHSSQVQIVNGSMSSVSEHIYTVVPDHEGSYTIPAFSVFSNGVEYKSNPLTLTVTRSTYGSSPNPIQNPFGTKSPQPTQQYDQGSDQESPKFWIESSVSSKQPYVSEQILFKFKLYSLTSLQTDEFVLPDFNDFWVEEITPERRDQEIINGQRYATYEKVYALFPMKAGDITIGETALNVQYQVYDQRNSSNLDRFFNDPFFNMGKTKLRSKRLKAPPIDLHVKSLPKPVPDDFTNLVGDFGVQTSLSEDQIQAGGTVTLEIVFSGVGNIKDAEIPEFKLNEIKTYADKPVLEMQKSSKVLSGKKIFKIALVPTKPGEYTIPALHFSYFDPKKSEYVPLNIDSRSLVVLPSQTETTNSLLTQTFNQSGQQEVMYQDIAPIPMDPDRMMKNNININPTIFYIFVLGLPCLFLIFIPLRFIMQKTRGNRRKYFRRETHRVLMNKLKNPDGDIDSLLEALRNYLAAHFNVHGKALTAAEMKELCLQNKISDSVANDLEQIVTDLEASQYGFRKESGVQDMNRLVKVIQLIQKK